MSLGSLWTELPSTALYIWISVIGHRETITVITDVNSVVFTSDSIHHSHTTEEAKERGPNA